MRNYRRDPAFTENLKKGESVFQKKKENTVNEWERQETWIEKKKTEEKNIEKAK